MENGVSALDRPPRGDPEGVPKVEISFLHDLQSGAAWREWHRHLARQTLP
jgi:hypothetical protein